MLRFASHAGCVWLLCCLELCTWFVACKLDTRSDAASCMSDDCTKPRRSLADSELDDAGPWTPAATPRLASRSSSPGSADRADARPPPSDVDQSAPAHNNNDNEDAGRTPACPAGRAPRAETCNLRDDDCDRAIDESCTCSSDEQLACYDGPAGTRGVGTCRDGHRSCEAGALGGCVAAVTPAAEICNGLDDDCNGTVDDGFALDSDPHNCGRCGNACSEAQTCCAGSCVDVHGGDVEHCGGCGMACRDGAMPGCCGGSCVDLLSDRTCGTCDNACGLLKLGGGFLCSCSLTDQGPACVARMGNNGLMICK